MGLTDRAVESGTVNGKITVANDHRILARQAMVKQLADRRYWPICSFNPTCVSVKPWFDGQVEERSFVTTISRVMSGHCSIGAHLERFRIVEDPICVCMMNKIISFGNAVDLRTKNVKKEEKPIQDLCVLQKWAALRLCRRFLRECGLKI
jgi:hypothetical protein